MSVGSELMTALSSFSYPISQDIYEGNEKKYFVWNYADERAQEYADDEPTNCVISIQLHLYVPVTYNYLKDKETIKNKLFSTGFTWPVVPLQTVEKDTMLRHIVFECEKSYESECE